MTEQEINALVAKAIAEKTAQLHAELAEEKRKREEAEKRASKTVSWHISEAPIYWVFDGKQTEAKVVISRYDGFKKRRHSIGVLPNEVESFVEQLLQASQQAPQEGKRDDDSESESEAKPSKSKSKSK